ncbi:hypothetical protein B0H13DRAFT_1936681 [Mycena leptocephala]|nr:hypothetical protein B0H13DRAFT_1936681 [Mycena leptocephala]
MTAPGESSSPLDFWVYLNGLPVEKEQQLSAQILAQCQAENAELNALEQQRCKLVADLRILNLTACNAIILLPHCLGFDNNQLDLSLALCSWVRFGRAAALLSRRLRFSFLWQCFDLTLGNSVYIRLLNALAKGDFEIFDRDRRASLAIVALAQLPTPTAAVLNDTPSRNREPTQPLQKQVAPAATGSSASSGNRTKGGGARGGRASVKLLCWFKAATDIKMYHKERKEWEWVLFA